jgi:hypothetical protein
LLHEAFDTICYRGSLRRYDDGLDKGKFVGISLTFHGQIESGRFWPILDETDAPELGIVKLEYFFGHHSTPYVFEGR